MKSRIVGAVISFSAVVLAACGSSQTVVTSGSTGSTAAGATTTAAAAVTTTSAPATIGSTLQLPDLSGGKVGVTVTGIVDPASGADQYTTPDPGKKFVAVEISIKNVGTTSGQPSPDNDVTVLDNTNASYSVDFNSVSECQSFNTVSLTPGSTVTGCEVFQIPTANTIAKVQYTPSAGFSNTTGQWIIPTGKG